MHLWFMVLFVSPREGAIDRLVRIYKDVVHKTGVSVIIYLSSAGSSVQGFSICLVFFLFFFKCFNQRWKKIDIIVIYIDIGIIVFEQLHLMCRVTLCIRASAGLPDTERIRQPGAS